MALFSQGETSGIQGLNLIQIQQWSFDSGLLNLDEV